MMVKPFEDAVFSAKKGDIVGPVESDFGWHVIYVTDIHPARVRDFNEVRADIEAEYIDQMALREFSERQKSSRTSSTSRPTASSPPPRSSASSS